MRVVDELISFYRHIYLNLPRITRLAGVALVLVVGLIHLVEAPEHFAAVAYLGTLFAVNFVLALASAVGIWRGSKSWGWLLGAGISAVSILAYLWSRALGLPGFPEGVGAWNTPVGSVSVIVEALFLGLYISVVTGMNVAYPDERHWDEDWHDYREPGEENIHERGGA
jgi:hypothetical protein